MRYTSLFVIHTVRTITYCMLVDNYLILSSQSRSLSLMVFLGGKLCNYSNCLQEFAYRFLTRTDFCKIYSNLFVKEFKKS